jgi:hypothetical protein
MTGSFDSVPSTLETMIFLKITLRLPDEEWPGQEARKEQSYRSIASAV